MSQAVSNYSQTSHPQRSLVVFLERLAPQPALLVRVETSVGSVPRETGAWMAVFASTLVGTVGGGRLEFDAQSHARAMRQSSDTSGSAQTVRFALGPSLGQCCGGVVHRGLSAWVCKTLLY